MQSIEPGESWMWCFVDQVELEAQLALHTSFLCGLSGASSSAPMPKLLRCFDSA
jgi:hypothetical protein